MPFGKLGRALVQGPTSSHSAFLCKRKKIATQQNTDHARSRDVAEESSYGVIVLVLGWWTLRVLMVTAAIELVADGGMPASTSLLVRTDIKPVPLLAVAACFSSIGELWNA